MTSNDEYVLQVLVENRLITQAQIDKAAMSLRQEWETTVDVLVSMGVISEDQVLGLLAQQFGMEYVHLSAGEVEDRAAQAMDRATAHKYKIVPLLKQDDVLTIAMSDPMHYDALDNLSHMFNCRVEAVIAPRHEIMLVMDRLYPGESTIEGILAAAAGGEGLDIKVEGGESEGDADDKDSAVIRLVSSLIMDACNMRASDIHLEPMERHFRIRYRVDGALQQRESPPKRLQGAILQRVKIMAGMKISEKRVPQDGRIEINVRGRDLDLRVSSVPTNHGESIVMRILDKQSISLGLPQLGFLSDDQQKFEHFIQMPDGVILVTGPTGSGKTTTLYACLGQINLPDRKLITVEDPVEYQLAGVNQVQVNKDIGMTFAAALRSILRQAPNIVMIGEIRDSETADIAMEAALTGHLVFSTLHTNDAPSAITRLLDIGVKPFLVASALRAAMAQRLVRCICASCKEEHAITEREVKMLGPIAQNIQAAKVYKGRGCQTCNLSGYKSRKGIFEMFAVDDSIQRLIFEHATATDIRARARELGMRTLREDGLLKVASGLTSIEEVLRATMGDAD